MRRRSLITGMLGLALLIPITLLFAPYCEAQNREVIEINDDWKFILSEMDIEQIRSGNPSWQDVKVPHTWNDKDIQSGDKVTYGTAWYQRDLEIDQEITGRQYFLKFDGVGQLAELFINGQFVGDHLGSYSAFVFNITNFLNGDTVNSILLRVNNELTVSYPKDNFLFGIYGGIYRNVSLIITNNLHIGLTDHASSGVYIHPEEVSREKAILKIVTLLKNDGTLKQPVTLVNRLISGDSEIAAESVVEEVIYPGGLVPVVSYLQIDNPRLWDGRIDPFLYQLETTVSQNGIIQDKVVQSTGIRYFTIDPERGFFLNGEPYRLYGVCRHQEWQDQGNALLPEHHRTDMELIDEIGATSIRLAHYQHSDSIYELADSLGILVWAEIPFVNGYREDADGNAKQQLTELIKQNFNSPSIFVWGLHNEVIKGKTVREPVKLTSELHNLAKGLDPSRYTVCVSNIWWVYNHPIHELADLQGFNQYSGWYGGRPEELGKWINNYHKAKPDIRFSVSEYGAGGNIAQQDNDISVVPDPKGQFFPEDYQTHYHEATWAAIDTSSFIWASYVWNMFDFSVPEWDRGGIKGRNHKGLVTYDRKTKKDAFYWYKANWSSEPVLYLTGRRNNVSDTGACRFKAYCNFGVPELLINGTSYGKMKRGINDFQYVSQDISLEPGEYKIKVRATCDDTVFSSSYTFQVRQ